MAAHHVGRVHSAGLFAHGLRAVRDDGGDKRGTPAAKIAAFRTDHGFCAAGSTAIILICYDGSADSRAAVEHAAELFRDEPATVLTVWQPFVEIAARSLVGFGLVPSIPNPVEFDDASRKAAEQMVSEGVALATELGMNAMPRTCSQATTTARAILAEADKIGASAIVMGSRGLTGVKSLLLGSVSHEVIQHADRTVAVVPSEKVARSRKREFSHKEAS